MERRRAQGWVRVGLQEAGEGRDQPSLSMLVTGELLAIQHIQLLK
jgi:hypothetical protein